MIESSYSISKCRELYRTGFDDLDLCELPKAWLTYVLQRDIGFEFDLQTNHYVGERVLVTGGGGSVGMALCQGLLQKGAEKVVALDQSERGLVRLANRAGASSENRLTSVIGSVCNGEQVRKVLAAKRITTVIHAAAYKHVDVLEENEVAAVQNNVIGTAEVTKAVRLAAVPRMVLISTDKAARPTSVMGQTKRLSEAIVEDAARASRDTKFMTLRFGNVFGSSGSVVPRFARQIIGGRSVTLTDARATRYFLTMDEAVQFALSATAAGENGWLISPKMGDPIRISDLCKRMINAAGYLPAELGGTIRIHETGLRRGENLHERLDADGSMQPTRHPGILRLTPPMLDPLAMSQILEELPDIVASNDGDRVRSSLSSWIETEGAHTVSQYQSVQEQHPTLQLVM